MHKDPRDSVTKDEPGNPKNVGKSGQRAGQDVLTKDGKEPGRYEVEEKGGTDRPAGKSTMRDQTSVDPKKMKT
jgi:hypothetical protein